MFRLWDTHNETWVSNGSKSIWTHRKSVENVRQKIIKTIGRNPDHLVIYSVAVEIINESPGNRN